MLATKVQLVSERIAAVFCPGALSNSYAVATAEGAYLVDAGIDPTGEAMLAGLRAIDRKPEDLDAIYITHWHNDHSAGAAALRERTAARVWYPELEREHFSKHAVGGLRTWLSAHIPEHGPFGIIKGLIGSSPPRAVEHDGFPSEQEHLPHGVIALHTPGHTPGHFSYWDPCERALFAGDALAVCGGKLSFMSRFLTTDLPAARATTRRLLDYDAASICPGHRSALTTNVQAERDRVRVYLDGGGKWPRWS